MESFYEWAIIKRFWYCVWSANKTPLLLKDALNKSFLYHLATRCSICYQKFLSEYKSNCNDPSIQKICIHSCCNRLSYKSFFYVNLYSLGGDITYFTASVWTVAAMYKTVGVYKDFCLLPTVVIPVADSSYLVLPLYPYVATIGKI